MIANKNNLSRKIIMVLLAGGGVLLLTWQAWMVFSGKSIDFNQKSVIEKPGDLVGILLPSPKEITPFALRDHHEKPFTLDQLNGKWSFLFFGYTHCPDVCPTSMGMLAEVFAILQRTPKAMQSVQGVFVTVDPERDTSKQLEAYLPFFHPDFLGVTGEQTELGAFAKQLGAFYVITPETKESAQSISHASAFFLIDPQGRFTALLQPRYHLPDKMADLFIKIRQHYGELQ